MDLDIWIFKRTLKNWTPSFLVGNVSNSIIFFVLTNGSGMFYVFCAGLDG